MALGLYGQEALGEVTRSELIARFGLALATTIVGLSFRVAIVDLLPTEESGVQDAEEALSRSIGRFRDQLDLYVDRLKLLSDKHFDTFETSVTSSAVHFEETATKAGSALESTVGQVGHVIDESMEAYRSRFQSKIEELALPHELMEKAFREPLTAIAEHAEQMSQAVKSSVVAQQRLSRTASSIGSQMESLGDHFDLLERFISHSGALTEKLDLMVENVARFSEATDTTVKRVQLAVERIDQGSGAVSDSLGGLQASLESISNTFAKQLELIEQHQQALGRELTQSRGSVQKVQDELTEAANTIVKHLG